MREAAKLAAREKQMHTWLNVKRIVFLGVCVASVNCGTSALAIDVGSLAAKIKSIGPHAAGHGPAIKAMSQLCDGTAADIPSILAEMDGASPLAENWLRSAVETIVQKSDRLPVLALRKHLSDTSHSPRSRRLAFELIVDQIPSERDRLIPGFIHDPALELRREAVAQLILAAAQVSKNNADGGEAVVAAYTTALEPARDLDQVQTITKRLEELGEPVDLVRHFGFITQWNLIGPFDNTDKGGFDVAYAPEKKVDLTSTHQGKEGDVNWERKTTDDPNGMFDVNKLLGKHMGAVAYAFAEFKSDSPQSVDVRLASFNGNKVWVNGKLIISNHTYHTNHTLDQYIGTIDLKPGKNQILVKLCQNEQQENWAQNWQFQLRVTDSLGKAILSQ